MTTFQHFAGRSLYSAAIKRWAAASVLALFVAMGAHYFIRDNERHYDVSRSKDKDFVVIEGATHGFTPCTECEKTPGQYSNSVNNMFDYMAKWMNDR